MRVLIVSCLILLFCESVPAVPFPKEDLLVIVVSVENQIDRISERDLKSIYLKDRQEWANGRAIIPVDLEDTEAQEIFSRKILKKGLHEVKVYWFQQIFYAKAAPPLVMKGDREVKEFIALNPGAIGYIHFGNLDSRVKAIFVGEKKTIQ